ncbi:MAG: tetratricopeptide repeat protein, partial [Planctomycetota bacterium]
AERARAALQAARETAPAEGEPVPLGRFLASWGKIPDPNLAEAQLAWLCALEAAEAPHAPARLVLALLRARTLSVYGREAEGIDALGSALGVLRGEDAAKPLPPRADEAFGALIDMMAAQGHFVEAEKELEAEIARRVLADRRTPLTLRLFRLQVQAVESGGATRLGQGAALVEAASRLMETFLREGPATAASSALSQIGALYRAAAKRGALPDAGARFLAFARERLPALFTRLRLESTGLVESAAGTIASLVSRKEAIRYVLDRADVEPPFFDRIGRDLWSNTHGNLATWRKKAGTLGDLEKRLLARVVLSLEAWLRGGRNLGRGFWRRGDRRFWAAKADAFATAASRVAELAPEDPTLLVRAATYLRGLGRKREAVALLLAARARGVLKDDALLTLARWSVADRRFTPALEILEGLLETRPEDLEVRILASKARFGAGSRPQAMEVLKRAEVHWRETKRWNDRVAARFGQIALEQGEPGAAVTWLEEAIRLREEARKGRRGTDARLAGYYGLLARARVRLHRTQAAIDAASAAVVAWGGNERNRRKALEALVRVLVEASDLDVWVKGYEARVAKEGLDAPVLRRALAVAYEKKDEPAKALPQLLAWRDLAPEDAEVHKRLVATYDALGRPEDAIDALLASLAMAPRNLDAAADLAKRYAGLGQEVEAERARTNLVEPLPHESAGHRRLAEIRVAEKRLPEAIVQWRQVVRTDPLDPTGWLALARTQIAAGDGNGARKTLDHVLEKKDWESRFGDVRKQAARLRAPIPE